jgi:hypothetical protein
MVGGILGGMRGVTLFPPDYIKHLHQANDILALAEYFYGSIIAHEHFSYPGRFPFDSLFDSHI